MIEDTGAQDRGEWGEAFLVGVVPDASIQWTEGLVGLVERSGRGTSDLVESVSNGSLAVSGDTETNGVGATDVIPFPTDVIAENGLPQQPTERCRRKQGLPLEPRPVPRILDPAIQPEIVSRRRRLRLIKSASPDVVFDLPQARRDVVAIPGTLSFPESDQRMTVPDTGNGLSHLPVAAHDHGRRTRA